MSNASHERSGEKSPKGRQGRDSDAERAALDEKLDEALDETFPASDPVAVTPEDDRDRR